MAYYLVAVLLIAHTTFWGAGLSWLVLPRRWRPAWWIFAPGFGLALQSAVVWAGAHTPVAGTNAYALATELVPAALLGWAARRSPPRGRWRGAAPMLAVLALAGGLLLWPMAQRGGWSLTSSSLGSCDHADYAAGARVLQEFSRDDRTGFLGLTEVTRVGSAENFFEFWLTLNHFTPSALLAHHAAVLQLQPHQLVSLSGVTVLLLTAPLVLLLGRCVGLRGGARLTVAGIYAVSPLSAYAVHHGALGQLYAAHGIALLTLAILGAAAGPWRRGEVWRHGAIVFAALWVLAGSYNFILTVALAPAVAWVGGRALWQRSVAGLGRIVALVAGSGAATVVFFWGRYAGVIERFQLFEQFDFGWAVPRQSPAAWLGLVADTALHGFGRPAEIAASAVVILAAAVGAIALARRQPLRALAAAAFVLPVVAGWAILLWESRVRANASYDAFKIVSVFYPGLLAGLCVWAATPAGRGRVARSAVALGLVLVAATTLWSAARFVPVMATPPLRLDRSHIELGRIETMARVTSLNMRVEKFWARLWANYFLLRKPQYFATHTYEGRLNTELKGEWDLSDSLLRALPPRAADAIELNARFHLVRVGAPGRIHLAFADGWHPLEGQGARRWRWSSGPAAIAIEHDSDAPATVTLRMKVRGRPADAVEATLAGVPLGTRPLARGEVEVEWRGVRVPPGRSALEFRTARPPTRPAGNDARELGFALFGLTIVADEAAR